MTSENTHTQADLATPAVLDEEFASLSYEQARSQLVEIVTRLEQGNIPLEDSVDLWERGEALARRCESWLDGARERLHRAQEAAQTSDSSESSSAMASGEK